MSFLSQILGYIGNLAITIISALGYPGLFFLMILESMVFPLPSELVMPFAGFLVYQGKLNLGLVIFFSSLGSLTGSLLSYAMGKFGGKKFISKYGKWFLLDESDLQKTEHWFSKRGEWTILIGRFVPVVRHLISLPAGMGKMNLKKFCIYTIIGATFWNAILVGFGYYLGQNWSLIRTYSEPVSIAVVVGLIFLVGGWIFYYSAIHKK